LLGKGVALVAVMVLILRPLVVALSTQGSGLRRAERAFIGWMAPRGIVAGATASSFGLGLSQAGVNGAHDILPITFIAILGTVGLYVLTALSVTRLLGVAGAELNMVLIVGGHAWARLIALALKTAGLGVRMWTGRPDEQAAARAEGLDAGNARLGVDLASREEELEEITDALVLTADDDFNALVAFELRKELGRDHVYRLAPEGNLLDLEPAYAEGSILFDETLTFGAVSERFDAGWQLVERPIASVSDGRVGDDASLPMFVVTASHELVAATAREATGRRCRGYRDLPRPPMTASRASGAERGPGGRGRSSRVELDRRPGSAPPPVGSVSAGRGLSALIFPVFASARVRSPWSTGATRVRLWPGASD
jgi:hypothetical protein